MSGPRITPGQPLAEMGEVGSYNVFRTLSRHPELFQRWLSFGAYLLAGELPVDERELMILRVAVVCGSSYEWGQHVRIALEAGMPREAIDRVVEGPDAAGWTAHESALLRAVDELHESARISDPTWATLAETYDERSLIEATVLIGQYHLLAFALNTFGVELDDGLESLPVGA
jgi:4-carboxymuconolactone decarboxylase